VSSARPRTRQSERSGSKTAASANSRRPSWSLHFRFERSVSQEPLGCSEGGCESWMGRREDAWLGGPMRVGWGGGSFEDGVWQGGAGGMAFSRWRFMERFAFPEAGERKRHRLKPELQRACFSMTHVRVIANNARPQQSDRDLGRRPNWSSELR
jgi:hypothetical protein